MQTSGQSEAGRLFREGSLTGAVTAANDAVRKAPADLGARILLAELLVFASNLARADIILDACSELDPSAAIVVAEFRQLVRGEMARQQLFRDGRVPEFLGQPTAAQRAALAALVALRHGDTAEAGRCAAEAEAVRVHPSGRTGDAAFDDLRDGDDLLAPSFEAITTTGKYFWIPAERVTDIVFHPAKRPRDLYWRRATMQVADGPDGDVYIPAIYPTEGIPAGRLTDELRLGRATDWLPCGDGGPTRGIGAATMLVGEAAQTLLEMTTLTFNQTFMSDRDPRRDSVDGTWRGVRGRPQLPLLDRLIDVEPDLLADRPLSASAAVAALRASIRNDLEALLNTRRCWRSWDPALAELRLSPVGFGLPDFAGGAFNDPRRREELRQEVEACIRRFEPRFASVSVVLVDAGERLSATLRLRIEALLHAEPAPEPITFDTLIDPMTTDVTVLSGEA